MISRTQVTYTHRARQARWRVTRSAQAVALFLTALMGAVNCADGSRVSGPFRPFNGAQMRGLELRYDSVAPAALKSAPRMRSVGAAAVKLSGRTATLLSSVAAEGGSAVAASPIAFAPESGAPFENVVPTCDDCLFGKADGSGFDIGFDFTFYGNTYRDFWISTNGFIAFSRVDNGCCEGRMIPLADDINDVIAVAWSDLNMADGQITFGTLGAAPNRRLVVDFSNVATYDAPEHKVSAQLILHEGTNAIEIHTASQPTPSLYRFTQGIENALGTEAAFVPGRVEALYGLSNDAIRFGAPSGNRAPSVSAGGNAGGPPYDRYDGREGEAISFKAVGSDVDNDELSYTWDFNGDGVADAQGAEASHAYPDNGTYTARVTASDPHGESATASVEVRVENVAPSAALEAADVVDEGSAIVISVGAVVDPSSVDREAGFEFAFDCGEGFGQFGTVTSASCATVDNGHRTVGLRVRDRNGGEGLSTKSVEIRNVAPSVDAGANVSVKSGQLLTLAGRFSDVGVNDRLWAWTWNTPEGVSVASRHSSSGTSAEQGAITGQYPACGAGRQTITLAVTDKDGGRGEGTLTVTVEPFGAEIKVKPSVVGYSDRVSDEDSDDHDSDRHNDDHGRLVTIYLFSTPSFDATSIDPASIRITNGVGKGTPLAVKKHRKRGTEWEMKAAHLNRDRLRDVKLRFNRRAMIANGDLTASTTSLTLVGRAGTCLSLSASGSLYVKMQ